MSCVKKYLSSIITQSRTFLQQVHDIAQSLVATVI